MELIKNLFYKIFDVLLPKFINTKKSSKEIIQSTPMCLTYNLDDDNQTEYLNDILKSDYKYILYYKEIDSNPDIKSSNFKYEPIFEQADNNTCINFIEEHKSFGIFFYNGIDNSVLNINTMTLSNNGFSIITGKIMLNSLKPQKSVLIISKMSDIPKNFSGSFQDRSITYYFGNCVTEQIVPIFKSTY